MNNAAAPSFGISFGLGLPLWFIRAELSRIADAILAQREKKL